MLAELPWSCLLIGMNTQYQGRNLWTNMKWKFQGKLSMLKFSPLLLWPTNGLENPSHPSSCRSSPEALYFTFENQ